MHYQEYISTIGVIVNTLVSSTSGSGELIGGPGKLGTILSGGYPHKHAIDT